MLASTAQVIITIAAAFALTPILPSIAGLLLIASGILAAIRLVRWQLWRCLARPDLICLGVGYAWLTLGLILLGAVKLGVITHFSSAVHAITVGALGTLSLNVMVRMTLLHAKRYPSHIIHILAMTGLMAAAVLARIGADFNIQRETLLAAAALAWSGAFAIALAVMITSGSKTSAGRPESAASDTPGTD